ncbi:MAG TPA: proton-conducting transporter membrane subunit [Polyangia bacterium]|jgi:hydrogenase-4 component F
MIPIWTILAVPAASGLACALLRRGRLVLWVCALGSVATALVAGAIGWLGVGERTFGAGEHLMLDSLSLFHVVLATGVFALSSLYAWDYFGPEADDGRFAGRKARRFGVCWFGFLASMVLVLLANNLGLMWVAMEATTVASALLICLEFDAPSIRAAWGYLLVCSIGIVLALMGTFLFCGEAGNVALVSERAFLWTDLTNLAGRMRPGPAKLAFLFVLVGYGTKAGLAPMHTWLPDAHSRAPTPVSAVLSGVLLNGALYAISRFLPLVDTATGGHGWAFQILVVFGLVSIIVAAAFIVHEHDLKRLLAYSSVEHMGIITLALGVGATTASLFHTFNHSVGKMLAFFCAGALVNRYGTRDMRLMRGILGAAPLVATGIVLGLLALIGAPPFGVFMSELWIARVGAQGGHLAATVVFLLGASIVFIAALKHVMEMVWRAPAGSPPAVTPPGTPLLVGWPLVVVPLVLLVVVGVWMPADFATALERAATVIRGQP